MKDKPTSYSDFTLEHLKKMFGIENRYKALELTSLPFDVPSWLPEILKATKGLPNANEKAKSEFFITPVMTAFYQQNAEKFQYFSGYTFDVDKENALRGRCDYLLSKSPSAFIDTPVFAIFEAKDDNLENWYGQCGAEMYASQLYNEQNNNPLPFIFGAVTNGLNWQFMKLEGRQILIDTEYYSLQNLPTLLGVLQGILEMYD
jgi:type I site-specific restriction endonuclease